MEWVKEVKKEEKKRIGMIFMAKEKVHCFQRGGKGRGRREEVRVGNVL